MGATAGPGGSIPRPGPSAATAWPSPARNWSGPAPPSPTARSNSAAPADPSVYCSARQRQREADRWPGGKTTRTSRCEGLTAAVTTSVVVVSHQPGQWLAQCLSSVVEQADEVVVVDNGSPGRLASKAAAAVGARAVRSEFNRGFADGVNL